MKLARLTEEGIAAFADYLDNISSHDNQAREDILNTESFNEIISDTECIPTSEFPISKIEAAKYLDGLISTLENSSHAKDVGMWAWLSLLYFEKICKKDKHDNYYLGKLYRWIPDPQNYQTYYRHLLAGPWRIYKTYREDPRIAMSVLAGEITTPGDVYEQLVSRQEFVSNSSIIELATYFYYDFKSNKLKRGAGGKKGGSSRRLAMVINQFSRTWDLYGMGYKDIAELLPQEFNKFIP